MPDALGLILVELLDKLFQGICVLGADDGSIDIEHFQWNVICLSPLEGGHKHVVHHTSIGHRYIKVQLLQQQRLQLWKNNHM